MIPYQNVRLLIPYWVPDPIEPNKKVRRDVIVEAIDMEKHNAGVNPLTGQDQWGTIPEEEAVDPITGDILWHRYIAGTREPIEWPWTMSDQKKKDDQRRKDAVKQADPEEPAARPVESQPKGVLEYIKTGGGRWGKKEAIAETSPAQNTTPEPYDPKKVTRGKAEEFVPPTYDCDTSASDMVDKTGYLDQDIFEPTLVLPPLPRHILEEVKGFSVEEDKDFLRTQFSDEERAKRQEAKEAKKLKLERREQRRQEELAPMKTPMQIKRDLEQAQKEKYDPANPILPSVEILEALGKYLAKNPHKAPKDIRKVRKDILKEDALTV